MIPLGPVVARSRTRASRAAVWQQLTEPEQRERWSDWLRFDAVSGGAATARLADGSALAGVIDVWVAGHAMGFTWKTEGVDYSTAVLITLRSQGHHTGVTITETGFDALPDGAVRAAEAGRGWEQFVTALTEAASAAMAAVEIAPVEIDGEFAAEPAGEVSGASSGAIEVDAEPGVGDRLELMTGPIEVAVAAAEDATVPVPVPVPVAVPAEADLAISDSAAKSEPDERVKSEIVVADAVETAPDEVAEVAEAAEESVEAEADDAVEEAAEAEAAEVPAEAEAVIEEQPAPAEDPELDLVPLVLPGPPEEMSIAAEVASEANDDTVALESSVPQRDDAAEAAEAAGVAGETPAPEAQDQSGDEPSVEAAEPDSLEVLGGLFARAESDEDDFDEPDFDSLIRGDR